MAIMYDVVLFHKICKKKRKGWLKELKMNGYAK